MTFIFKLNSKIFLYIRYFLWRIFYVKQFKKIGKKSYIESPYFIFNHKDIVIGENFKARRNFRLEPHNFYQKQKFTPKIIIGDNVSLETDCHIGCINKIVIGNNVLIASRVFITDHSHGKNENLLELFMPPVKRPLFSKGPVIIKDNVWIGENVSIMPNVTIGANAIIGANSVVTKNIPDNAIAAGVPAKVLKIIY